MKTIKNILIITANYIPVVISLLLYSKGVPTELPILLLCQVCLVVLNFFTAAKKATLLCFDINLALSCIIANILSTYLYFYRISSDSATLSVGYAVLFFDLFAIIVFTFISYIVKARMLKSAEQKKALYEHG